MLARFIPAELPRARNSGGGRKEPGLALRHAACGGAAIAIGYVGEEARHNIGRAEVQHREQRKRSGKIHGLVKPIVVPPDDRPVTRLERCDTGGDGNRDQR